MNNAIRLIIFAIVIGGLAILAFLKLKSNQQEVESKIYRINPDATALIQAETLRVENFEYSTAYLGSFTPNKEVLILSEGNGRIVKDNIKEGASISKGQIIAQLDTDILQNQLKIAESNLSFAEKTAQRMSNASSGLSEVKVEEAQNNVNTLKYQIELYKKQISMATIKAPFSGIITAKFYELGSLAGGGTQLAMLTDISTLKLEINVPESDITKFEKGMGMDITTKVYPNQVFKGVVDVISVKADGTKKYQVKLTVSNNSTHPLKAGMYGTVTLSNSAGFNSLSIPRTALVGSNKKPEVFIIKDGVAKRQAIVIGASNEERLQVLEGINENEVVATGGLVNLSDGTKVTIAKN